MTSLFNMKPKIITRPHPTRKKSKQYFLYVGGLYNGWYTLGELYGLPERHPDLCSSTIQGRITMANSRENSMCKNLFDCISLPLIRESELYESKNDSPFFTPKKWYYPDLSISKLFPAGSWHKVK